MADLRRQQHGADGDQQYYSAAGDQQGRYPSSDVDKSTSMFPQQQQQQQQGQGPSASQIIAVVTLVPLGGTLLLLAGLTLAATFVGVAVSTPVFVIFSPVLVPAIITVALAVAGILTSGAFGITGLSSFSWLVNYLRRAHLPQQTIRGVHDTTDQWMQKAKDLGQTVSSDKAHETGDAVSDKAQEAGQNVQTKAHESGQKAHDTGRTREGGKTREVRVA